MRYKAWLVCIMDAHTYLRIAKIIMCYTSSLLSKMRYNPLKIQDG